MKIITKNIRDCDRFHHRNPHQSPFRKVPPSSSDYNKNRLSLDSDDELGL